MVSILKAKTTLGHLIRMSNFVCCWKIKSSLDEFPVLFQFILPEIKTCLWGSIDLFLTAEI